MFIVSVCAMNHCWGPFRVLLLRGVVGFITDCMLGAVYECMVATWYVDTFLDVTLQSYSCYPDWGTICAYGSWWDVHHSLQCALSGIATLPPFSSSTPFPGRNQCTIKDFRITTRSVFTQTIPHVTHITLLYIYM